MKFWCLRISQNVDRILDRYLPYDARAEICQKFGYLFGRFEDTKISFWDELTFNLNVSEVITWFARSDFVYTHLCIQFIGNIFREQEKYKVLSLHFYNPHEKVLLSPFTTMANLSFYLIFWLATTIRTIQGRRKVWKSGCAGSNYVGIICPPWLK